MYVSISEGVGTYPLRRAVTLAESLQNEAEILFLHDKKTPAPADEFACYPVDGPSSLHELISRLQPDLLLRDCGNSYREEVAKLRNTVPAILHFDDFGDGGQLADLVVQTLYAEHHEPLPDHYLAGYETFTTDESLIPYMKKGEQKPSPPPLPHLVISFGDDPGNLTYRALRHLKQLQIPLRATVLIGSHYTHDIGEIQMMALSRRNTSVVRDSGDRLQLLSEADVVLCDAVYTPYEVAAIGVPCIVLAHNEWAANLAFPNEQHGFIHLGLGRKVTQSNLLNAIMEPLLHDARREHAVKKQLRLNLGGGAEKLTEAIRYLLEFPPRQTAGCVTLKENR